MIEFHCEHCQQKLKVPDTFAGKKAKCPHCKMAVDIPLTGTPVPMPGDLDAMAHAAASVPAPAPVHQAPHPAPLPATPGMPFPAGAIDAALQSLRGGMANLFPQAERVAFQIAAYGLLLFVPLFLILALSQGLAKDPSDNAAPSASAFTESPTLVQRTVPWGSPSVRYRSIDRSSFATPSVSASNSGPAVALAVLALAFLLCQYVASKIRSASLRIIEHSPSRTCSSNILDCLALLLLLGSVVALILGGVSAFKAPTVAIGAAAAATAILVALLCLVMGAAALNPRVLNVLVVPGESAGSEAMGLTSFVLKLFLRTGPLALAAAVAATLVALVAGASAAVDVKSVAPLSLAAAGAGATLVGVTGLYLLCYLLFLGYHLWVDVVQAIFQTAANTRKG